MARLIKNGVTYPAIRWIIREDVPRVIEIERGSFSSPWSESDLMEVLRDRNCIGLVYESSAKKIGGFMVYELGKRELRLISLCVAPDSRRARVGSMMVERLISKLGQQNRVAIECCVGEYDLGSQLFFSSLGFKAVGSTPNNGHDVIGMSYRFRYGG